MMEGSRMSFRFSAGAFSGRKLPGRQPGNFSFDPLAGCLWNAQSRTQIASGACDDPRGHPRGG